MTRPETGVMQFEGDWPGVFIRSDNAFMYAHHLELLNTGAYIAVSRKVIDGLIALLRSCDTRNNPEAQMAYIKE